jgi:hypothetical protein
VTVYHVAGVRAALGVRVATLPLATTAAATSVTAPTARSRKVAVVMVAAFTTSLNCTVTGEPTSAFVAPDPGVRVTMPGGVVSATVVSYAMETLRSSGVTSAFVVLSTARYCA